MDTFDDLINSILQDMKHIEEIDIATIPEELLVSAIRHIYHTHDKLDEQTREANFIDKLDRHDEILVKADPTQVDWFDTDEPPPGRAAPEFNEYTMLYVVELCTSLIDGRKCAAVTFPEVYDDYYLDNIPYEKFIEHVFIIRLSDIISLVNVIPHTAKSLINAAQHIVDLGDMK